MLWPLLLLRKLRELLDKLRELRECRRWRLEDKLGRPSRLGEEERLELRDLEECRLLLPLLLRLESSSCCSSRS